MLRGVAAQWHAFALNLHHPKRSRDAAVANDYLPAIQMEQCSFEAQKSLLEGDLDFCMEVNSPSFEELVFLLTQGEDNITGHFFWAAVHPWL